MSQLPFISYKHLLLTQNVYPTKAALCTQKKVNAVVKTTNCSFMHISTIGHTPGSSWHGDYSTENMFVHMCMYKYRLDNI